jgi:ATP-binding cassette subfamily D (ALD) protein 4
MALTCDSSPGASQSENDIVSNLKQVYAVSKHCIFLKPWKKWRALFPLLLVTTSLAAELMSVPVMRLISQFYHSISNNDKEEFRHTLVQSVIVLAIMTTFITLSKFAIEACSLQWREDLTHLLHSTYFYNRFSYDIISNNKIDNPDQRIVTDTERYATLATAIISKLLPIPFVISYYTWHLYTTFGFVVPMSCYVYFLFSAIITSALTTRLIPIIYRQDVLEGNYRFAHSRYRLNVESIAFLDGEIEEKRKIEIIFSIACQNLRHLIIKRIPLNLWTTWFSYLGSIGKL